MKLLFLITQLFKMKTKIIITFLSILFALELGAQTISIPPQYPEFNTGRDQLSCLNSVGQQDDFWEVSGSMSGPYIKAIKVPHHGSAYPYWAGEATGCGLSYGWIGYDFGCNYSPWDPANHGCSPGTTMDLYFKFSFTLPVNPVLVLNWQVAADDQVMGIYVNNLLAFTPPAGNHSTVPFDFKCCTGWVGNQINTIIIHVRSAGAPSGPNYSGLEVISWATPGPMTTAGSPTVCNKTGTTTYTVTQIPPGTTSYSWTFPGWSGTSSGPTKNPAFGSTSGILNTYAYISGGCIGASTLNVNVVTPPVGISSPTAAVCACAAVALTATGAVTYSWSPPSVPATSTTINPITVNPCTSTSYTVTGWDANGCKKMSTPLVITAVPKPTVSLTAQPALICAGVTNILTAGGASTYTWLPSPPGPAGTNTWAANFSPASNTLITVLGRAANGCTNTAVITLTAGQTIPLTAPNVTLCTDISPCTTLNVITNFPYPVSYTWQPPASGNQASVVVCPISNINYIVTASSNSGCASSATVAVTAHTCCPPPTAIFSLPTSTFCNANYWNLALYASVSGTFSGVGVTFSNGQYNFNSSVSLPPSTYTIAFTYTTLPYACTYTLFQTVVVTAPLAVQGSSVNYCGLSPFGVPISATLVGAPATSYIWYPGNIVAQTITVAPTTSTVYMVIVQYPGCTSVGQATVTVNYTCCPQASVAPIINTNALTSPGMLAGPIIIDKDITISGTGDYYFHAGDFIMSPGIKIIVQPGVNLFLTDAHLYGCSNRWKGIQVMNGGNVTSVPGVYGLSTFIEDADVAIDVDNIASGHAVPLLRLDGVVFNQNEIGIYFHNSSLTSIQSLVKSCVFTARNLPSSTLSWLGTSLSDLRYSAPGATNGLAAPFSSLSNYSSTNTFSPDIGIRIDNISNTLGGASSPGIELTGWAFPLASEFNLFENLHEAIKITNASFTTNNNTFQKMDWAGLAAIGHTVTGMMNARLSLSPPPGSNPNTGNRFWQCYHSIIAEDIYDFDIEQASFRMDRSINNYYFMDGGIAITSSRFNYRIINNNFNNIVYPIDISFRGGFYQMFGFSQYGVYANSLNISQNFFSPELNTTNPLTSNQTMGDVIQIRSNNSVPWDIQSQNNYIQSNRIDRMTGTGIYISGINDYPIEISNNNILTLQQPITSTFWGILLNESSNGKVITYNAVTSDLKRPSLGHCYALWDSHNTVVECNEAYYNGTGFWFSGDNNNTSWMGNTMLGNKTGMLVTGDFAVGAPIGRIGQQGNPNLSSGNQWLGSWGPANGTWETYVDGSAWAGNSQLFVNPGFPYEPLNNSSWQAGQQYAPGNIIITNSPPFICPHSSFPPLPSGNKTSASNVTSVEKQIELENSGINIFPNPNSGTFTIASDSEDGEIEVTLLDLSGKTIYHEKLRTENNKVNLDLFLEQGVYLVSIENNSHKKTYKKLIISK